MSIYAGSRYERLSFTPIVEEDGSTKRFLHLRVPGQLDSFIQHELLPKEEFDFLAMNYSGQSRKWWLIAEANDLFWPFDLDQGTRLDIPF